MKCSIPNHINQLNVSQKEKERLSDIEFDTWKELIDSKLFDKKGSKLLMPKNEYGKALSKIGTINKSYSSPIVRLSKQEIGEVIKVNASTLTERDTLEEVKLDLQTLLRNEINDTKPVGIDTTKLTEVLWGTFTDNGLNRIFQQDQSIRQGFPDISTLQERISGRTFNEIWDFTDFTDLERKAILLHTIQQRLSDRDSFNGKLFEKINRELGVLALHSVKTDDSKLVFFAFKDQIYLDIDKFYTYLTTNSFDDISKYLEIAISEELIHVVTYHKVPFEEIKEVVLLEMNKPTFYQNLQQIYRNLPTGDYELAFREYVRMVVQQEVLGITTEKVKFTSQGVVNQIIEQIWNFIKDFFKPRPKLYNVIQRHIDFIEKSNEKYYQLSDSTLPHEVTPELRTTLEDFVKKVNPDFEIKVLDDLLERQGLNGVINFKDFVISLQRGREGALTEEVAHLLVETLPKDSLLYQRMLDEIPRTRIYKDVVKKYKEVYGGDVTRLKKEAMAQLIATYLSDRENFKRLSGSDSLIDNLVRWIKDFFQWLKGNKEVSSFIIAANKIVNLDTSDLSMTNVDVEEMYSVADVDAHFMDRMKQDQMRFQSLGNKYMGYYKVYININNTIFDTNSYKNKSKKDIFFSDDLTLNEYYTKVKTTPLGKELEEKISSVGKDKFVFYTNARITQVLIDRLVTLYGIRPDQVIRSLEQEDIIYEDRIESKEVSIIEPLINEEKGKVLVIDNSGIQTNKEKFGYNANRSSYRPLYEQWQSKRKQEERKEISKAYYDEFERIGVTTFSNEVLATFKLLKRELSNIEALGRKVESFNNTELSNLFEDSKGVVGIPIQLSNEQRGKAVQERLLLHEKEVMNFVTTIESATAYYKDLAENGFTFVDELLARGDTDSVLIALWELNRMTSAAKAWQNHIKLVMSNLTGVDKVEKTREMYSNLLGTIMLLNNKAMTRSVSAIQERLMPLFDGSNLNKEAVIKDLTERLNAGKAKGEFGREVSLSEQDKESLRNQIEQLKSTLVTPKKIASILLGEDKDINATTLYIKTLINSENPVVSGVDMLLNRGKSMADEKTIKDVQAFVRAVSKVQKEKGISDKEIFDNLIVEDIDLKWDDKAKKFVPASRLALLNPYKNRYVKDEKALVVKKAYDLYKENKTEENKQDWLTKKKEFETWNRIHFYEEYSPEYYNRFDELKQQYGDLVEEAFDEYRTYSVRIRELQDELNWHEDLETQKDIKKSILAVRAEQRQLRSKINQDGTPKSDKGQSIAEILNRKAEIDKDFFDYDIDHSRFERDFIAFLNTQDLTDVQLETFKLHLFTKDYAALNTYADEVNMVPISNWLELNTNVILDQEFYDARTIITNRISELIKQLGSNTTLNELWQDLLGISSSYRDEDGILDGSVVPENVQEKVMELESEIERVKKISQEESGDSSIKKELYEEIQKLKELQSKVVTEFYTDEFFAQAFRQPSFQDSFIQAGNDFGYSTNLSSLINSKEFELWLLDNPDHSFTKWFLRNHIVKSRRVLEERDIVEISEFVPTYIWNQIVPNDKSYIKAIPSFKYSQRKVKDEFRTEKNKDTFLESSGEWLPKSSEFMSEKYVQLMQRNDKKGEGLREIRSLLEEFHFESQEGSIRDAKIDWFYPSVQKIDLDSSSIEAMWDDFTDNTNRLEDNEGNPDEVSNRGRIQSLLNQGFLYFNSLTSNDSSDPRNKIPVPYSYYAEPNKVSRNVIGSLAMYRGSTNTADKILENAPGVNLILRLLEDESNPYKVVVDEQGNERTELKNARKEIIKTIEFQRSNRMFGENKIYEVGKGIDRTLTGIRKLNSFGSLSDVTGFTNNIKNNLAGRIQNIINSDFANWSTFSSMKKANLYKKSNFFWFLNQSEKEVKEKDWHIQAFFNPGLSNKLIQSILPNATKRFFKTNLFSYSSHVLEYSLATNTLYAHLFDKKVERTIDGKKEVKTLHEILTVKDNGLDVEEGWVDSRSGRVIDKDYLYDKRKQFQSIMEYVQGKVSQKTYLSTTTIGQSLLYFKNWLVPMIRRRFDKKRANYAIEEDVEGYWNTFVRFIYNSILSKRSVYHTLTEMEQRNINSAVKEMAFIILSGLVISLLFGFDYDDPDKYKKLREKPYLANLALLLMLQVQNETESLSLFPIYNVAGGGTPPIAREGYKFIKNPFMGITAIDNSLKLIESLWGLPQYDRNMPAYNIEKGDYKAVHYAEKVMQIDDLYYTTGNPEGKIQVMLGLLKQ